MAKQVALDNSNVPFVLTGSPLSKGAAVILQDATRTAVLAPNTLMAKVSASGKYVPYTDPAATDGTAIPRGIYVGGEIAAADLVAGDISDCPIIIGGNITIDTEQLVLENSVALTDTIGTGVYLATVEDYLANIGIFVESTIEIDSAEHA